MHLEGSLKQFPLAELIAMIIGSSVTGVLEINYNGMIGQIFFYDGRPYHAITGALRGFNAVCRLFEEHDAVFTFRAGVTSDEETVQHDPWTLVEQASEQASMWARIRPLVPSLDCVPHLRTQPRGAQVQISEAAWPALSAVDGQRSVQEIADHLGYAPIDVAHALYEMLERGLITIETPRARSFVAPEPTPVSGFFGRLLAGQAQK